MTILFSKYDHLLNDAQWMKMFETLEERRIALAKVLETVGFYSERLK